MHFKNWKEWVKGVPPQLYNPFAPWQTTHTAPRDPNAMDVDQGRAWLAGAEDILYNEKYQEELQRRKWEEDWWLGIDTTPPKPPFKPQEGYHHCQQELRKGGLAKVKCFNCGQMGHISRYCPQKHQACYVSPCWLLYDYATMEVNGHMEPLTDPWPIYDNVLTD